MTITKQQLVDKYNEVYAADNGVNKTFVQLTKDEKVEALLQFVTALTPPTSVGLTGTLPPGLTYESTATITRAADTTIYTASAPNFDVYGSLFELENIGVAGEGIFLSYFEISLNLSAVPQGMTSFAVHLYPTAPTTIADNSIWTIGSDPVLDPVGFNVSMSLAKGGGKVVGVIKDLNQLFILTSSSLWGYLVTNGAVTPAANSETGTIRARSVR